MKKVLIYIIDLYQQIPGGFHQSCKYIPTCSNYGKEAIIRFGVVRGSILTIKRILKCNPFSKGGIDLVPERKNKNEKV